MRMVLALMLLLAADAAVAAERRECVTACEPRIAACRTAVGEFGIPARLCRARILRRCARDGVWTCYVPTTTVSTITPTTTTTTTTHPIGCSFRFDVGFCGGTCGNGLECRSLGGLGRTCGCAVSTAWRIPCEGDTVSFPTCNGTCPGTLTCRPNVTSIAAPNGECLCQP